MTTRPMRIAALFVGIAMAAQAEGPVAATVNVANGAVPAQTERQDSSNDLSVVVGRSVLLDCVRPVERVAIGLGGFAEATAISSTEIMINGKAEGETSLILWEKGGNREFFNLTVRSSQASVNDKLEGVRRELRKELPGQAVNVTLEHGSIFLSGTAKNLLSSQRAEAIASVAGKVVNLLNVEVPAAKPQILLKVIFASVDRSRSQSLGINLFSTGLGNTIGGITTQQFSPPSVTWPNGTNAPVTSFSNELNILAYFPGLNMGATIQALQTKGVVEILAEPNVLAEDGKQGSFLAGGEYPYPVVQAGSGGSGNAVTIQFKEYGIRLNFIPTITPRGTIQLQVAPEVSALDFASAVQISGFNVPAIDVRKVKTEVELSEGQSFAIGGLLDNRETKMFEKVPFLGNIPVLGKFFQSESKSRTNTELIVVVTPEIVKPLQAGTTPPKPNFPEQLMEPNSKNPMHHPDEKASGEKTAPPPSTIPVEQLIESQKPEQPLVIEDSYNSNSTGGSSSH